MARSSVPWASTTAAARNDFFRDSKALQIFDGTSEIHTVMIGRDALNGHR
jgi:alkylation response protein AidB-like acyl-CoA dehydrogenase